MDALGLCCITVTNTVGELHQNLRIEADSSKVGYSNAEAAYFAKSFTKTLSHKFVSKTGRDLDKMNHDARALLAFAKFKDFDNMVTNTLYCCQTFQVIKSKKEEIQLRMRSQDMATKMAEALSDLLNFVQALFLWMQTAYVNLVEEQGKSLAESV